MTNRHIRQANHALEPSRRIGSFLPFCLMVSLGCALDQRELVGGSGASMLDPHDAARDRDASATETGVREGGVSADGSGLAGNRGGGDSGAHPAHGGAAQNGSGPVDASGDRPTDSMAGGQTEGGGGTSGDGGLEGMADTGLAGSAGRGGTTETPPQGTGGTATPPVDPRTVRPGAPNASLPLGCSEVSDSAWTPTTYCHIQNNGFDKNGNALADVGDTTVWIYWAHNSVSGWICVNDDQPNGRGLHFRVLLHKKGADASMPSDAFVPASDSFALVRDSTGVGNACQWTDFAGAMTTAIDSVVVEWEDSWMSSAGVQTSHYDGRYVAGAPASL